MPGSVELPTNQEQENEQKPDAGRDDLGGDQKEFLANKAQAQAEQLGLRFSNPEEWKDATVNEDKMEMYIDTENGHLWYQTEKGGEFIDLMERGDAEKIAKWAPIIELLLKNGARDSSLDFVDKKAVAAKQEYNADQKEFGSVQFVSRLEGNKAFVDFKTFEKIIKKEESFLKFEETSDTWDMDAADAYDDEAQPKPEVVIDFNSLFAKPNKAEAEAKVSAWDSFWDNVLDSKPEPIQAARGASSSIFKDTDIVEQPTLSVHDTKPIVQESFFGFDFAPSSVVLVRQTEKATPIRNLNIDNSFSLIGIGILEAAAPVVMAEKPEAVVLKSENILQNVSAVENKIQGISLQRKEAAVSEVKVANGVEEVIAQSEIEQNFVDAVSIPVEQDQPSEVKAEKAEKFEDIFVQMPDAVQVIDRQIAKAMEEQVIVADQPMVEEKMGIEVAEIWKEENLEKAEEIIKTLKVETTVPAAVAQEVIQAEREDGASTGQLAEINSSSEIVEEQVVIAPEEVQSNLGEEIQSNAEQAQINEEPKEDGAAEPIDIIEEIQELVSSAQEVEQVVKPIVVAHVENISTLNLEEISEELGREAEESEELAKEDAAPQIVEQAKPEIVVEEIQEIDEIVESITAAATENIAKPKAVELAKPLDQEQKEIVKTVPPVKIQKPAALLKRENTFKRQEREGQEIVKQMGIKEIKSETIQKVRDNEKTLVAKRIERDEMGEKGLKGNNGKESQRVERGLNGRNGEKGINSQREVKGEIRVKKEKGNAWIKIENLDKGQRDNNGVKAEKLSKGFAPIGERGNIKTRQYENIVNIQRNKISEITDFRKISYPSVRIVRPGETSRFQRGVVTQNNTDEEYDLANTNYSGISLAA